MGLAAYRKKVSESKHKAILDAAHNIFLAHGFSRAAMAEIAQEADVSTATLYKHFNSKEELFASVIDDALDRFGGEIPTELADEPVEEALQVAAKNYLKIQYEGGINALIRVVIAEAASNPHLGRQYYEQGVVSRNQELVAFLQALEAQGKLKLDDPMVAARQILGLVKEELIWPAMFDAGHKPGRNADRIIQEGIKTFLARYGA